MKRPTGIPDQLEQQVLADSRLTIDQFRRFAKLLPGARRPLVAWPENLNAEIVAEGVLVTVTLPSGVYATTLLRELLKSDDASARGDEIDPQSGVE
jgi:tRNA pseudouridine13 synthase